MAAFVESHNINITNWEQLTNLEEIEQSAFANSNLGANVVLPDQVQKVGDYAFGGTSIKSITFPKSVVLGEMICWQCTSLESITFRGDMNMTKVKSQFADCSSLKTIDFSNCTTVPDISAANSTDDDAFCYVDRSNVTLKVPAGKKSEFESKGWTDFKISETIQLTSAGELTSNMLEAARNNGTSLKIAGPMNDADFSVLKNFLSGLQIYENGTPIDLDLSEAEVTTIPESAFNGSYIRSYVLGNVALPKSVKTIGEDAFNDCYKLNITNWEQLTQLTTIGGWAFYKNSLGGNVVLPNSVTEIGWSAFYDTKIMSVSLPDGVKLNQTPFGRCGNLQTITFRGDVTFSSVNWQFSNCKALTTIDFSHCTSVPDIRDGNDVFNNITRSNVTLKVPAGMTEEFRTKGWTDFIIVEQ